MSTPPATDDAFGSKPQIWAPWRYEYVKSPHSDACFLCVNGVDPATDVEQLVIGRGTTCYTLLNRFPYNPGHLLVTPYRHVAILAELDAAERVEIFDMLIQAQAVLEAVMQPHGYNIGANLGRPAGAAIADHLHWHIVPRWTGDTNFMPVLAGVDCVPQALTDSADLLRKAWATV